ncbi:MAG: RnfABCDGE type electron transport complex subunit G [Bacteroidales bacterium]|nr:RnfABCDGE type electron transport complex subunit G [Bacteroidales bacterium]MBQ1882378.1 RnfABCDGE type electron transport complex subunit G [Bacteroidales bacterium]
MVLVLTLVCLGASAAVAVVYAVTKDPIAAASVAKTNKAIEEVVPQFDNNPSEEVLMVAADLQKPEETNKVYVAKKGGEVVGYAVESTTKKGFGGAFSIMVGFTPDGKVFNTSVLSHSETPGLGAKITDKGSHFITQWKGKNLTDGSVNISVKKDGGDIDAITASTISSRAFCDAMERAANTFSNINTENQ